MYLSILDQTNNQVGGSNSGAGTIATCDDTEVFDWTFATAGTYYMVVESNGDMPLGYPTYAVSYRILSMGTSSSGRSNPSSGPPQAVLVRSLHVASHQHGRSVTAKLNLGQDASVSASLQISGRATVAFGRSSLSAGSHKLMIKVPAAYAKVLKRSGLSVSVGISVHGGSGLSATYTRRVLLTD